MNIFLRYGSSRNYKQDIKKTEKKYTEITIVILSSSAGKSFKFNPKDHEYKENGAINHVTSQGEL